MCVWGGGGGGCLLLLLGCCCLFCSCCFVVVVLCFFLVGGGGGGVEGELKNLQRKSAGKPEKAKLQYAATKSFNFCFCG